jgi:membrane protein implicated in regulation of membrane protease activity
MEPGLIWILAGCLLLVAELALPGIFLFWVGLAALATGAVLLLVPLALAETLVLFLAAFGLGLILQLRMGREWPSTSVNTPDSGLVGRSGLLLPGAAGGPRVRIGDSEWPARLPHGVRVPEGPVPVRVEGVEGTTLLVRPE